MTTTSTLSGRDRAILRAVAAGGAELQLGTESDLFLDGRCCCDQSAAHQLVARGPRSPPPRWAWSASASPPPSPRPGAPRWAPPPSPRDADRIWARFGP